jgi:hypothetical protein
MSYKPKISCICPTRGRFETLRESISFFILQDYPNKELIIFNNHPEPIVPHPKLKKHNIKIINAGDYTGKSIQQIYSDCLKHISEDSEYIAIWDDDDFYFPFHLSSHMDLLLNSDKLAIRASAGYWQDDSAPMGDSYTITKNTLEASMIVKKEHICFDENNIDENSQDFIHPHLIWMNKFENIDNNSFLYNPTITAIYRWNYGKSYSHLQSSGVHKNNIDTGNRQQLKPKDVRNLFYNFIEKVYLTTDLNGDVKSLSKQEKSELYDKIIQHDISLFSHIDKYNVWLYWNTPETTPVFINECINSIKNNTFANCVILNDESLRNYNLPEYFWNLNCYDRSDFIRVYFLNKYGGWWFDTDTFIVGDLDKHYFQHLINNETYFPSEYNVPNTITTPILCSKPNGVVIRTAWEKIDEFLKNQEPPYNFGWAKLNFVGILSAVDQLKYSSGWHFVTVNNLVKWHYNNDRIKDWSFDDCESSKLQIYLLHWSQIGAEVSWKINLFPGDSCNKITETYPNLIQLFDKSKLSY